MKAKMLIAGIVLSTAMLSPQAMAQENVIESFLGRIIKQAVAVAGEEINNSVRHSVANATYNFSLSGETKAGSVSVTDLTASNTNTGQFESDDE